MNSFDILVEGLQTSKKHSTPNNNGDVESLGLLKLRQQWENVAAFLSAQQNHIHAHPKTANILLKRTYQKKLHRLVWSCQVEGCLPVSLDLMDLSSKQEAVKVLSFLLQTASGFPLTLAPFYQVGVSYQAAQPAQSLADALDGNDFVDCLEIKWVPQDQWDSILACLPHCRGPRKLVLDDHCFTRRLAQGLSAAFQQSTTMMEEVSLRNCQIGDVMCRDVLQILSVSSSLRSLDLSSNSIGDRAMMELSRLLGNNTTLESLHLDANYYGDIGLYGLARALRTNTTLEYLTIGPCEDESRKKNYNDVCSEIRMRLGNNRIRKILREQENAGAIVPLMFPRLEIDSCFFLIRSRPDLFMTGARSGLEEDTKQDSGSSVSPK
eukprot:CAMPEP_0116842100 /NCGR_PEP_ID=MMETSP0418-20121206/11318_1 /TAXON_ID=1158023 /ORGANISM="Astrosyne radiata, Strain 13vi08-1A" /LENGTH=378 /DNA_ID=CAMNT_0004472651 /DNA_START=53 /DNA_END=1189 /DNA_ORIENTATION=+